jgi:hypothetical protein
MNKKTEMNLMAVFLIVIGIFSIFQEIKAAIILIVSGIVISSDIRSLILKAIGFLWKDLSGKKQEQKMNKSPEGIQQQAERDAIVNKIERATIIFNPTQGKTLKDNSKEKATALRDVYKKMIKPLKLLNLAANRGLTSESEFKEIEKSIEEFIDTKVEHEIDFSNELKNKLNEVMAAFRHTSHELYLKLGDKKLNEGLHGTNSFDFILKCKEATTEIEKLLK